MELTPRDERVFNRKLREFERKLEEIHFENIEEVSALLAVSELIIKKIRKLVRVEGAR